MVNVAHKALSERRATACARVTMNEQAYQALRDGTTPKGDVLATVRLAAIMGCKKTSELVPLCHPLPVESAKCEVLMPADGTVEIRVTVGTSGKTGVEMEAMTGASVGALTLYDMLKALDKSMVIGPVLLLEKTGGKSGPYKRESE